MVNQVTYEEIIQEMNRRFPLELEIATLTVANRKLAAAIEEKSTNVVNLETYAAEETD